MGPLSARSYQGRQLLPVGADEQSCRRAKQEADYGRRVRVRVWRVLPARWAGIDRVLRPAHDDQLRRLPE